MTRTIALTVILAGFSGCIIYDNDGPGTAEDRERRIGDDTGLADEPNAEPEIPAVTLKLAPPQAESGETFIGRITVEDGDFELGEVSDVVIYGDAIVNALVARTNEVLISVSTLDDASPGPVDILVELESGLAAWMPAALEIFPVGSGQSASDYLADNPDSLTSEDSARPSENTGECP